MATDAKELMEAKSCSSAGANAEKLRRYAEAVFHPEDEILRSVREESKRLNVPQIQVSPMDGLFLETITRAAGVRKAIEIGTLAGYSGICIARGLAPGGKLFTFEIDPGYAEIARSHFLRAGLADRIEVFVGPALKNLFSVSGQGPFDLVFIDADKPRYSTYFKWAEENLRVGGILLADNAFAFGLAGDERIADRKDEFLAECIREFNQLAAQSGRFRATVLPTSEGMTFAVKLC